MKLVKSLAFLTIVALPTYIIRCKNFSWCVSPMPFTLLEVFILATFLAWLVWVVYSLKKDRSFLGELFENLKSPLAFPLAFFIASATISLFATSDLRGGLGIWKAYFVEGALFYLVVVDVSIRQKDFSWVLKALILSGLLVSLASVGSFLWFTRDLGLDPAFEIRISGLYEFANAVPLYLGGIVALSVSVIITFYKTTKGKGLFYLSIVTLLFMLGAIFLSQSKGGVIGVFFVLMVWFGYLIYKSLQGKFKQYFKYLLALLAIFYVLISGLIFVNIDSLAPNRKYTSSSILNRYCIWQGTRDLLFDKPLTGSGLNGFHLDYKDYKTCLAADYQYPHNILLTFWAETGLLGLVAFASLAYVYVKVVSKGVDEIISVGLLAALVYILIHGLVDVPFFKNDLSIQFWLFFALATINHARG